MFIDGVGDERESCEFMYSRYFFLKFAGLARAYFLLIVIAALMLIQLTFSVSLFLFDSNIVNELVTHSISPSVNASLYILLGFLLCCTIWYCYRPVILVYLFVKDKLSTSRSYSKNFPYGLFTHNSVSNNTNQYTWITGLAAKISKKLDIRVPRIVFDKSPEINAKVLPGFIHSSLIILTQGLLDKLTPDEIEAVIAHELAHVAMQDTFSMSVTDLLILICVWMPVYIMHLLIDYIFLYKWRNKNIGFISSLFFVLFCYGFFPLFILNTINRRYELRADKIAMQSTNLHSFVSALNSVHDAQTTIPNPLQWCLDSMPKVIQVFVLRTFLSHPSIPSRIQALM